ncbi:DUF1617 family protein [Lactococcus lactis]|uniref:DUF1617 family protein n=1 Tax=Lactococcus lactis subsp. lactis A12 TaxID=1137134 RepID=S6FSQ0_LACLL|nr:DUF1617 family protein [Lactococcus lactis]CDG04257.1 putative uncharacterized protein [Lactococcus lactis subsp. lactis A12]SBW30167.1 putative uncharacterized protein [Lactococcus lactis subsp. lactis]
MLKIKNEDLVDMINFLKEFELPPKISRIRTKLCKLIQVKVDELYHDEVELLGRYGKKDEDGNLVQHDGNFSLIPETAMEYHKEKADLLNEDTFINTTELQDKLLFLIAGFEESTVALAGKEAEMLDLLLEQLETEVG